MEEAEGEGYVDVDFAFSGVSPDLVSGADPDSDRVELADGTVSLCMEQKSRPDQELPSSTHLCTLSPSLFPPHVTPQ